LGDRSLVHFPEFRETAEYLKAAMTAAGLRDVELLEAPADGVSRAGIGPMPLAWDVKQAQLEIVAPVPCPEFRLLAIIKPRRRRSECGAGPLRRTA
jgi:hypothetical protein